MQTWVLFTLLAASMQTLRTAGQKSLAATASPMGSTLVRYLFGLPFVVLYLVWLRGGTAFGLVLEALGDARFVAYATLASVAQICATALLVSVLGRRNFTVATSFAKTEAVQAAAFGTLFFASSLSTIGWLAVLLGFVGIFVVGMPSTGERWNVGNVLIGSLSGSAFALTSLWLREASLGISSGLGLSLVESAALTLCVMVTLQTVLCLAWVLAREPDQLGRIASRPRLSTFIGATSAFGSVGWFTAMSHQSPALVKSLGQVEIVFTMIATSLVFGERTTRREYAGVLAIVASVPMLLLTGRG